MELKSFIYGAVSVIGLFYFTQLTDNLMNLFSSWITYLTQILQKKINNLFADENVNSPQIGFSVPSEEYYEDEEGYEDRAKIGFK